MLLAQACIKVTFSNFHNYYITEIRNATPPSIRADAAAVMFFVFGSHRQAANDTGAAQQATFPRKIFRRAHRKHTGRHTGAAIDGRNAGALKSTFPPSVESRQFAVPLPPSQQRREHSAREIRQPSTGALEAYRADAAQQAALN